MKTIQKNPDTIPGIPFLYAIPINFITSIINANIQFSEPVAQITYAFEKATDSDSMSSRSVVTDAGVHYSNTVRCFIPGLSSENAELLNQIKSLRFMVIFQSYGGDYWRLGNKDYGLKLTCQETTSPRIGYEITFTGNLLEPPKIVNAGSIFP